MTKTINELYQDWINACADYDRAVKSYYRSKQSNREKYAMTSARHAMDKTWRAYDAVFTAYLDAMDDAAKLKPCESATTPAPPPPLPR